MANAWQSEIFSEFSLKDSFKLLDGISCFFRIVHEPRHLKTVFVAPPVRHTEFGIKLKLVVHVLIIHLLLFM